MPLYFYGRISTAPLITITPSPITSPAVVINGVTAGANVYQTGNAITDGVTYNVYAFTTGVNTTSSTVSYTINYTCNQSTLCYVMAVGGGGGGGGVNGGGGGAGGVVMNPVTLPVGTSTITVAVGNGGAGCTTPSGPVGSGIVGSTGYATYVNFAAVSSSNIIAYGGGGGNANSTTAPGIIWASGGGGGSAIGSYSVGGTANNINNNYANSGSNGIVVTGYANGGSGGGGAGTAGIPTNGVQSPATMALNGGDGIQCFLPGIRDYNITSSTYPSGTKVSNLYWGGGGGGGGNWSPTVSQNGGLGGGGAGTNNFSSTTIVTGGAGLNPGGNGSISGGPAGSGGTNTGGGGGGSCVGPCGSGGSGIVIIAFPQSASITVNTSSTLTNTNFSTGAYNSIYAAYGTKLLNYNYYGPALTLRYVGDVSGTYAQNFYADLSGNLGTQYLATGQSLTTWLQTKSPSYTTYAYVTKWYDQGMDNSFNCAYQYIPNLQPIYDVANKLLNFGYQGGGGGVAAPTTNCYMIIPNGAFPQGDNSYTITTKLYNFNTTNGYFWFNGNTSANYNVNALGWRSGATNLYNVWNSNDYGVTWANTANATITCKYTTGSLGTRYIYINNSANSGTAVSAAATHQPGPNYIGCYSGITNFGNHQMYYMYIINSALSDSDRNLIENTV
jgi:hypothetical protein